jgi:hypothetical protein
MKVSKPSCCNWVTAAGKQNRLAEIVGPVSGVHFTAVENRGRDGGVDGQLGRTRPQRGQQRQQLAAQGVHLGAVRGDSYVDLAGRRCCQLLNSFSKDSTAVSFARKDDAVRAIHGRHRDPSGLSPFRRWRRFCCWQLNDGHQALPFNLAQQAAAAADDARRIVQG